MFQVPYTARQQYLAAEAEARAAQARAEAAKAEYLAQQALLQEEVALKARLYELEQRKRYASPATSFAPDEYTQWPLQQTNAIPSYQSIGIPSLFSYSSPAALGRTPPSTHQPYHAVQPQLDYDLLEREQALERLCKEKAARLEAERDRLRKEQEAFLAQLAAKKELERKKQEIEAARANAKAYYVCNPCTTAHRQGARLPCLHPTVEAKPIQPTKPCAHQPRKPEEATITTEEDLKKLFAAIFGSFATAPKVPSKPTAPKPQPQPEADAPPAKPAPSESLVDQLKARYKVDSDEEIKDTILAVIDSLSQGPAAKEAPKTAPAITKKPSFEASLVEQLQARSQKETDQELRDTIQATINSLLPELNTPPSPSASTSSSSKKDKAKASPPATPSVESRLDQVSRIQDEFHKFESEFVFPSQLDFVPSANPSSTAIAHLAFTARNHPVRFYEQCLASLLAELDSIESQGDATLRSKRKETVRLVEQALETLEQDIMGKWNAMKAKEEPATSTSVRQEEAKAPTSFTVPISDGNSPVMVDEETPVDTPSVSTSNNTASTTIDEPLPSSEEAESHPQEAAEEPQLDEASTSDSQITIKVQDDAPLSSVPDIEGSPVPATSAVPEVEVESSKSHVEESESNDRFLLAQTETEEEATKHKFSKAHADDIGSDWSELDA